jgi:hypothetical protein
MSKLSRAITIAVVVSCGLGVATSGARPAGTTSPFPGIPGIPKIPSVPRPPNPRSKPGATVVTFKMIVDGETRVNASRSIQNQALSTCKVTLFDEIEEHTIFQRGKGLTMEFVRVKENGQTLYYAQRPGRTGDATFTVVWKLTRKATGQLETQPLIPGVQCFLAPEDVSTNPDCSKTFSGKSDWGIRIKGATFSIAPAKNDAPKISSCGTSTAFPGLDEIAYQWPTPYPFSFKPLPLAKMFGRRHAFQFILSEPSHAHSYENGPAFGTDAAGPGIADLRFIRVPNAP